MGAGRPHWLRPAGATRTPTVVVCFDTETREQTVGDATVQTLRLWDALTRVRPPGMPWATAAVTAAGSTAAELADVLEGAATITGEAWCFAHNIGFDLAVTAMPDVLAGRGWRPRFVHVGPESCVFKLVRDGRTLVLTDAWSWLRASLAHVAKDVGMRKAPLPDADAGDGEWHRRCAHDVALLDRAIGTLLDWWDREQLGVFGMTSASCGWQTARAKLEPGVLLVGAEQPRTLSERQAIMGGAKRVWRVGEQPAGRFDDWDFKAAYPTVCAHLPLPMTPLRHGRWPGYPNPLHPPDGAGTACKVLVEASTPCAPCRVDGDVWWPVGQFVTTLTSAELPWVCEQATSVTVLQQQWYRLGLALQPWGRWVLRLLDDTGGGTPAIVRRVAKGWGRAVTGRFALQTSRLVLSRFATKPGWGLETGVQASTGRPVEIITWGGVERTYLQDEDGQDVAPIVLAFIEGYVRAALGRVVASRPAGSVVQANTDGWWERRPPASSAARVPVAPRPFTLARKTSVTALTVLGPNHTLAPGDRRLSGIPHGAEPVDDGGFVWRDWPGLRFQLQASRPGEYVRPVRHAKLDPHYVRGWVLEDGRVVPPACMVAADGTNRLRSWAETPRPSRCAPLAVWQVPALHALRGV